MLVHVGQSSQDLELIELIGVASRVRLRPLQEHRLYWRHTNHSPREELLEPSRVGENWVRTVAGIRGWSQVEKGQFTGEIVESGSYILERASYVEGPVDRWFFVYPHLADEVARCRVDIRDDLARVLLTHEAVHFPIESLHVRPGPRELCSGPG